MSKFLSRSIEASVPFPFPTPRDLSALINVLLPTFGAPTTTIDKYGNRMGSLLHLLVQYSITCCRPTDRDAVVKTTFSCRHSINAFFIRALNEGFDKS